MKSKKCFFFVKWKKKTKESTENGKKCGIIYITRGYISKKERRKYVKFIYRMLQIFIIIVFVFLVFFVEECIRLELNLYDKPLVKLKVEKIKSNNKNIYIEEVWVLLLDMNMILTKSQRI